MIDNKKRVLLIPAFLFILVLIAAIIYFRPLVSVFSKIVSFSAGKLVQLSHSSAGYFFAVILLAGAIGLVLKKILSFPVINRYISSLKDELKPLISRFHSQLVSRSYDSRKVILGIALIIIFLALAPYIFTGQDTHVKIFDNLDAWFPQQVIMAESGKAFSMNPDTTIEQYMNGLPLSGFFGTGFNIITLLLMVFPPFAVYALNLFIMAFTAFFGMYLLLKRFIIKEEAYHWVVVGAALCYSLLPFYPPSGLSIAGLPLLVYCFLKIKTNETGIWHYAFIFLFPFYSLLPHAGMFILIYLGIIFLFHLIKEREFHLRYFLSLIVMVIGYCLSHFHIIYSLLDPNFISYRTEIKVIPIATAVCWRQTFDYFVSDITNLYTGQQLFVILGVAIVFIIMVFHKVKETGKVFSLTLLIFLNALLWGFKYWEGLHAFRLKYQLLNALNLSRFFWLNPFLWYILFGLSLFIIARIKFGKPIVLFLILAQVFFMFSSYNWEYRYRLTGKMQLSTSLTYRQFYSEALFEEIEKFINKPQKDYRIVCLGIHPGIANYNGFYTLDVYSNIYPLEHKHNFRRIIEKEIEKSDDLKRAFDDNAKRCYLLTSELHKNALRGLTFSRGITKNDQRLKLKNLQLNTPAFKQMGGRYIFSAVEILNYAENDLAYEKRFVRDDSPWSIYLYRAL